MSEKTHISEIVVNGFKSFAMRTAVKLHEDLTCVVGPNGCGKSNICDAIQWVLGEQAPSHIRSQNMAEVIFAGTAKRKPYGLAEVTLVLNAPKATGSEKEKLSITRRVVPTGESAYLVNDKTVRLRDVLDLLNSAGLNISSYSIIGQGRIESVLTMRPAEKRLLIEESAGILRFRDKRRQTLLKLDEAEKNLEIVSGILKEQESQARSLKIQAGRARAFLKMVDEERELLRKHFGQGRDRFARDLEAVGAVLLERQAAQAELLKAITELEAETQEKEMKLGVLQEAQKLSQEEFYGSQTEAEKRKVLLAALEEQARSAAARLEAIAAERETLAQQAVDLEAALQAAAEQLEASVREREEGERGLAETRGQAEGAQKALLEAAARVEAARGGEREALQKRQELATALVLQEDRHRKLEEEVARLTAEARTFAQREEALQVRLDELARQQAGKKEALDVLSARLQEALGRRQGLAEALEAAEREKAALEADLNRKQGECEMEKRALEHYSADRGTLAAAIKPPLEWEAVVDFLLDDLATAIPLEAGAAPPGPGLYWRPVATPVEPVEGATPLSDLLPLDPAAPGWLQWSLPSVYYVREPERLLPLAERHPLLTFFDASGRVAHGALIGLPPYSRVGVLGSSLRVQRLTQEIEALGRARTEREGEAERHRLDLRETEARAAALREERDGALRDLGTADRELAETQTQQRNSRERREELEGRAARAAADRDALAGALEESRRALQAAMEAEEETRRDLQAAREAAERAEGDRNALAARLGEEAAAFQRRVFAWERLRDEERRQTEALGTVRERHGKLGEEEAALRAAAAEGMERAKQVHGELAGLEEKLQSANAALMERAADIAVAQEALKEWAAAVRDRRAKLETVADEVHQAVTRREVLAAQREDAAAACREALGIALEECPACDEEGVDDQLRELRAKKERFGAVNILAEQEYSEVERKLTYIVTQKDDLEKSIASLRETLKELETTALERFTDTFVKVNQNFQKYFQYLFGGGVAEVRMMDDANPLEAGIELFAQPPGKRTQHVLLLSGGERALASMAFLIALFSVSPSPFLILDEGDAALDDANVERFLELVGRLKKEIQVILITHNRRTMETASTLIGVTMDEPGCSKVVSLNPGEVWEKMKM
jgi:chromosome segregation protein